MIRLTISTLPPSVNALYRNVAGKGRVKTSRYADWIDSAGWEIAPQLRGHKTFTGKVRCNLITQKRGDADNKLKAIFDLLQTHRVYENDKQITSFTVLTDPEMEGCMIEVEAVEGGVDP